MLSQTDATLRHTMLSLHALASELEIVQLH